MAAGARLRAQHGQRIADVEASDQLGLGGARTERRRQVKLGAGMAAAQIRRAQDGDVELCVKVDKASIKKAGASDDESAAVSAAAKALQAALLAALRQLDADMLARVTEASAPDAAAAAAAAAAASKG